MSKPDPRSVRFDDEALVFLEDMMKNENLTFTAAIDKCVSVMKTAMGAYGLSISEVYAAIQIFQLQKQIDKRRVG